MKRRLKDDVGYPVHTSPFKRRKIRRIISQVTTLTREVLTIYSLVKTKNPLSIGLGVISSVGMIYDNLGINSGINAELLKKRGYQSFSDMDPDLIYNTLKHVELEEEVLLKDDENDSIKIVGFVIDKIDILFYLCNDEIYGPFLKDKDEFIKKFSKFVFDRLGNMIKIESKMMEHYESVKFSSLNIGTDVYISTINEKELINKLQLFRERGFSRSLLFYGPPGVGKTTLVGRMAEKMGGKLVILHPDTIDNIEMPLLSLLNLLNPDIILFDDIDRINEFNDVLAYLEELNRFKKANRLIIGTVNNLHRMPEPMKRPGRFDQIMKFEAPNSEQIREIILAYSDKFDVKFSDSGLDSVVLECENLTPAFIQEIVKRRLVYSEEELFDQIKHMKELLGQGES